MKSVRFLTGKPALLVEGCLVVSDLHLGIEKDFRRKGIKFPSQTEKMASALEELLAETGADRLFIIGDVKHNVPGTSFQEIREIPEFFSRLSEKAVVEVVPGNHDGGLDKLLPENVTLHPSSGVRAGDFYLNHGHTWPGEDFLNCSTLITGHQHSVIEFRDGLGYVFREPVWIRGSLLREKLLKKYNHLPDELPGIIIMPPFSGLAGGIGINSRQQGDFMGPLSKALDRKTAGLHLLDGTYIGTLQRLVENK